MKAPLYIILLIIGFPIAITLICILGKSFSLRLAVWYASGFLISQWMHVMIFVFYNRMTDNPQPTELNIFYFYHAKWSSILIWGMILSIMLALCIYRICQNPERIDYRWLVAIISVALILSQAAGSSVPKFFGELSMTVFFLLGILSYKYFLTYPAGVQPLPHQIQSDALTAFGLLVAIISIWSPFVIGIADLMFKKYFAASGLMLQFQLTRYASYVIWILVGISIVGWESIQKLILVRKAIL